MKFGAHMSIGGGIWKALERGRGIDCEVVQIFVKNNIQWFGKPLTLEDRHRYEQELASGSFDRVFAHSGYLINIAGPPSANREKSLKSLTQELQLAADLGLPFLVLHPGAHLGYGEESGLQYAVDGLNEVIAATADSGVRIALENTAGQGSCLGYRLSHLREIYRRVQHPERLAVCLDTAHLFEAGYDVRDSVQWDAVINEIDSAIGLSQIVAFHLNDSKTDLGSRVDRHAGIGQGKIGREAFEAIVNDPRFSGLPGCIETPKSKDLHEDVENLRILKSLRGDHCPGPTRA